MSSDFLIKSINTDDYEKELELIGFDSSYKHKAVEKLIFKNLKIYSLTVPQANILKQVALSVGADCATHKEVITGKQEISDAILSGSFSQLRKIAQKLRFQPFGLKILADKIEEQLNRKQIQTKIVGILNITDNSFSDGGEFNSFEKAVKHFDELVQDGADIIDIGAESTKPNTKGVSSEEQIKKIVPVLEYVKDKYNIPISIDTRSSLVAQECLRKGASIINDVSGLKYDPRIAKVVAEHNATLVIQHSLGNEVNMVENVEYENIMDDVFYDINRQITLAKHYGVESIIIDPGIGFDKNLEENFVIINRIEEFFSLGYPVMTGISRKSLLNLKDSSNEEKDIYTLALNTLAIEHNVDYIRVHNVKMHKKLFETYKKLF
ncbi:dihydropteroate synthase [bacterium]|nr:dihydropteroate synthase [bacterium]